MGLQDLPDGGDYVNSYMTIPAASIVKGQDLSPSGGMGFEKVRGLSRGWHFIL